VAGNDELLLDATVALVGQIVSEAWKQENKGQAGGKIAEWKQDSELLHQAIEHMDDAVSRPRVLTLKSTGVFCAWMFTQSQRAKSQGAWQMKQF
jgi:hypothetical protein